MRRTRTIGTMAALWLGLAATTAQAATPCITQPEAEALAITFLPDLIDAVGTSCAASLPPQAFLRTGLAPMVSRYRAEAPAVLPQAKSGFSKLIGDTPQGIDPDLMRPMITAMLGPMLAKEIKPADCAKVDRMVGLLAPLPPANTAGIIVMLFTLGTESKKSSPPFRICPAGASSSGARP